jgi:hypothetical protein
LPMSNEARKSEPVPLLLFIIRKNDIRKPGIFQVKIRQMFDGM